MKTIIYVLFFLLLPACGAGAGAGDIEKLKQSILSRPCDPATIEGLRREIEDQSRTLTPEQLKRALQNMSEDTRC